MRVERLSTVIKPNPQRVICQSYNISKDNVRRISEKLISYADDEMEALYRQLVAGFGSRHLNLPALLDRHFHELEKHLPKSVQLSATARRVLASYFSKEFSFEAAALFNPSIVGNGHQMETGDADLKFIMSLRATGEGHISSIEFMRGTFNNEGSIRLDPVSNYATTPQSIRNVGKSTIELEFDPQTKLSERIIFPITIDERNGIEDLRMVMFNESHTPVYYGTYTAYDGRAIRSKLLETSDFLHFRLHRLNGAAIRDKGMALFPEKINGKFAMISRQDSENLRIMFSDDLLHWDESHLLLKPQLPWELAKVGNCGSPLKTKDGWLLLTHGVGAMRKYSLGICLLDRRNPSKVLARLKEPLIEPNDHEREGYVPNVVYSCGGIIHGNWLLLPYAMSDSASGFARVNIDELFQEME